MIKTITFAGEKEGVQEAIDWAEEQMNHWLSENEITRRRFVSHSTNLTITKDGDGVNWTIFAITVVYETL